MEKTVEIKSCKNCGVQFEITDKDLEFYDKVSPVFGGTKYSIPTPTHCPDCRQQRRLAFRNERKLYRRKCDATGENIISIYSPDKPYKVYDRKFWSSDKRDPSEYGVEFDNSKSFLEQFESLLLNVPRKSLYIDHYCENSPFANQITNCKDSYLLISAADSEKCYYSKRIFDSVNCVDCFTSLKSQECYEGSNIHECFKSHFLIDCNSCSDSYFLYDCQGCNNCILSANLQNKQYYINNISYTKEEYETLKEQILSDMESAKASFKETYQNAIHRFADIKSSESITGNNIKNAKNSNFVFDVYNIEDVKYSQYTNDVKSLYDVDYTCCTSSLSYEISTGGVQMHKCAFSIDVWPNVESLLYCDSCYNCSHLFGCVGMSNKQYCILNKQYTKEEYEELVPQIIEKMIEDGQRGEFFPISISTFGYNETLAQEHYPQDEKSTVAMNLKWQKNLFDPQIPAGVETITKDNAPQDIQSVTDDILKKLFICEVTGRPFRIIKQELEFYKKHNLPLPTKHPDQRHLERLAKRNPRKLWKRKCDCSNCASNNNSNGAVEFLTTYSPERKEKVYCETCYNKEIYG